MRRVGRAAVSKERRNHLPLLHNLLNCAHGSNLQEIKGKLNAFSCSRAMRPSQGDAGTYSINEG